MDTITDGILKATSVEDIEKFDLCIESNCLVTAMSLLIQNVGHKSKKVEIPIVMPLEVGKYCFTVSMKSMEYRCRSRFYSQGGCELWIDLQWALQTNNVMLISDPYTLSRKE